MTRKKEPIPDDRVIHASQQIRLRYCGRDEFVFSLNFLMLKRNGLQEDKFSQAYPTCQIANQTTFAIIEQSWTSCLHCALLDNEILLRLMQPRQEGVFHFNTLLTLELASPYFASGRQEEMFEVVVMENKNDGHFRSVPPLH